MFVVYSYLSAIRGSTLVAREAGIEQAGGHRGGRPYSCWRQSLFYSYRNEIVGSTLVARLLGELEGALSVREPRVLRDVAILPQDERATYVAGLRKLFSRSFARDQVALVKATPDQFTELARFKALDGKTWNHPVVVGDVLLARNGEQMAAFRLPLH